MSTLTKAPEFLKPYQFPNNDARRDLTVYPWLDIADAPEPVRLAAEKHSETLKTWRHANGEHQAYLLSRESVMKQIEKHATAEILAGRPDPGDGMAEFDAKAGALYRKARAFGEAVLTAWAVLECALAEHGAEWASHVDADVNDQRQKYLSALAALKVEMDALDTYAHRHAMVQQITRYVKSPAGERGYCLPGGIFPTLNPPQRDNRSTDLFGAGFAFSQLWHRLETYRADA